MWPRGKRKGPGDPVDDNDRGLTDGEFQAMDQVAAWVRFADTKATILTAGLGVVLTLLLTHASTIADAFQTGWPAAIVVGGLSVGSLLALAWTLFWLLRAIGPQRRTEYSHLNRFAWPSMVRATPDLMTQHRQRVDVRTDAWQQVVDLSRLAARKYEACGRAVPGFAALVLFGMACVVTAIGFTT